MIGGGPMAPTSHSDWLDRVADETHDTRSCPACSGDGHVTVSDEDGPFEAECHTCGGWGEVPARDDEGVGDE